MGQALTAAHMFKTPDAAAFRQCVLAGARRLDIDEVRFLADQLHASAKARRDQEVASIRSGVFGLPAAPAYDETSVYV